MTAPRAAGRRRAAFLAGAVALAMAVAVGGCGIDQQAPDLFLLTRTGPGPKLTLLPNDGGTIRCDGGKPRTLPDPLLIAARDLAQNLDPDARHHLTIAPTPGSVFYYRIRLQNGTIAFPDRGAGRRKELAQATLFAAQAAQQACGLTG